MNKLTIGLVTVLGIVASFFATGYFNIKGDLETTEYNHSVALDSIEYYQGKDGIQRAKIRAFEGKRADLFLNLESKDKEIIRLQEEVKRVKRQLRKGGGVVTAISTVQIDTVTKTIVKYVDGNPIYSSDVQLENWVKAHIEATKDSTSLDLEINNAYTVVIGETKNGLFKKPTPFVEVSNDNPYVKVESLRAYKVSAPNSKRWGIGVTAGYGITNTGLSPFIGVGVNYNLIQW